jgi:Flp pilus assembly protein TadD
MAEYLLSLTPDDPQAHITMGRTLDAAGDAAGATNAYMQAIAMEGTTPRVETRLALGEMARRTGQVPDALRWYEEAASITPDDWTIAYNLGLLYSEIGDREQAMTLLGRAMGLAPAAAQPRIQEAMDAMLQGG